MTVLILYHSLIVLIFSPKYIIPFLNAKKVINTIDTDIFSIQVCFRGVTYMQLNQHKNIAAKKGWGRSTRWCPLLQIDDGYVPKNM